VYDYVFISEHILLLLICGAFYFLIRFVAVQHKKWLDPSFETPSYSAKLSRWLFQGLLIALGINFVLAQIYTFLLAYQVIQLEQVIRIPNTVIHGLWLAQAEGWIYVFAILLLLIYYKFRTTERLAWLKKVVTGLSVLFIILLLVRGVMYFLSLQALMLPALERSTGYTSTLDRMSDLNALLITGVILVLTITYRLLRQKRKNIYYRLYLGSNLLAFIILAIPYQRMGEALLNTNMTWVAGFSHHVYFVLPVFLFLVFSALGSLILSGIYLSISPRLLVPSFGRAYALKFAGINFISLLILTMVPIYPLLLRMLFD